MHGRDAAPLMPGGKCGGIVNPVGKAGIGTGPSMQHDNGGRSGGCGGGTEQIAGDLRGSVAAEELDPLDLHLLRGSLWGHRKGAGSSGKGGQNGPETYVKASFQG